MSKKKLTEIAKLRRKNSKGKLSAEDLESIQKMSPKADSSSSADRAAILNKAEAEAKKAPEKKEKKPEPPKPKKKESK